MVYDYFKAIMTGLSKQLITPKYIAFKAINHTKIHCILLTTVITVSVFIPYTLKLKFTFDS